MPACARTRTPIKNTTRNLLNAKMKADRAVMLMAIMEIIRAGIVVLNPRPSIPICGERKDSSASVSEAMATFSMNPMG